MHSSAGDSLSQFIDRDCELAEWRAKFDQHSGRSGAWKEFVSDCRRLNRERVDEQWRLGASQYVTVWYCRLTGEERKPSANKFGAKPEVNAKRIIEAASRFASITKLAAYLGVSSGTLYRRAAKDAAVARVLAQVKAPPLAPKPPAPPKTPRKRLKPHPHQKFQAVRQREYRPSW